MTETPAGPTLVPYGGHVNLNVRVPYTAVAWMPKGWPFVETDIGMSMRQSNKAAAGFRLRLWFSTPTDTQGMVIVVTDQRLVSRGDLIAYRVEFDQRVAQAQIELGKRGNSSTGTPLEESERCRLNPDHSWCWPVGQVPPPPRREDPPPAPTSNVTWLPGYWTFHRGLDDFIWVEGTFMVREESAPPSAGDTAAANGEGDQPAAAPSDPQPEAANPQQPLPEEIEPEQPTQTVVVAPTVPERPSPKREIVLRPPAIAGAVWVKGYWELRGNRWVWVKGRWRVPRQRGVRFRAPRIDVRGEVRVYLPGGWVLGKPSR
jgi:hypothetical protein